MLAKYRRPFAISQMIAANPENVTIVLRKEFARAAQVDMKVLKLVPLAKVLESRGLEMRSYAAKAKDFRDEIQGDEPGDSFIDKYLLTPLTKAVFGYVANAESKKTDIFQVNVPFEALEDFIDELSSDDVAPMINKVYAGQVRVL